MPAFVQALTPSSTKTSATNNVFVSTPASGITAGNVIVVAVATNNSAGGSPSVSSIGKPAGETNSWVALGAPSSPTATALAGVRTSLWAIETTVAWPGSTDYAITLSGSVSAKAAVGAEFSGLTATRRGGVSTTASSTTGVLSATHASPNLDAGDILFAASGWEDVVTGADDTDALDGAWSTGLTAATAGSTADTNIAVGLQWKILTGTSSQTWNSTGTSTDATAILSALVGTGGTPGTFDTLTGEATADGGSASMTGEGVFDAATGEATADGGAVTMTGAAVFSTLTGSATADGGTASMSGGAVFTAGTGTATAEGGAASFIAGTGATFDTLTGSATADGGATTMTGGAVFSTLAGSATGDGGAASFVPGAASAFVALTGAAVADGGAVTMSGGAVFSTLAGSATATGGAATMTGAGTFGTLGGAATANGGAATMTGGAVFSTLVGAALAAGGEASFDIIGDAPVIPRLRTLVGAARPFDLTGASRSVTLRAAGRPHELETP